MPEPMKTMTKAEAEKLVRTIREYRALGRSAEAAHAICDVLDFLLARTPEQDGEKRKPVSLDELHTANIDITGGEDSVDYVRRLRGDSCPVCGASDCDLETSKTPREAARAVEVDTFTGSVRSESVWREDLVDRIEQAISAALAAQRQEIKDRIGKLPGNTVASRDAVLAAIDATPTD